MDKTTSTPRRPIVPGPGSGIGAKAVAMREQKAAQSLPSFTQVPAQGYSPLPADAPLYRVPGPVGNLAKGIAGVMSECGTITKSGYNKFHNYHYATLQDLLFAITPLMGKHGVVVIQNEVERSLAENRIMVTYEFSIFHTSGEMWPERPRFTGMSIGRNSKGEYDDKAINKCHSAARKYFLLSLFQVPSGDFDDADEGPAQNAIAREQPRAKQRPSTVPGPGPAMALKQPEIDERSPHKIVLAPGSGADKWASKYLSAIEAAESTQEITEWDGLNDGTLQMLSDKFPDVYEKVRAAAERRMEQLTPTTETTSDIPMPDPAKDTQEAMNWVAQGLLDADTYEKAEMFWNGFVAPREKEFDPLDWDLLLNEWRRAEVRLNPEAEEPEAQ